MQTLLNFDFLVILNFLVLLLWPTSGRYSGARSDALSIIMLILTIIAVVLDIVFMALKLAH
jgi:hypothetical protein